MSNKDFDYETYTKENPPTRSQAVRGYEEREQRRREIGEEKVTISLDARLVEKFKQTAAEGKHRELIEQALSDWLTARGVSELLRQELPHLVQQMVSETKS